MKEDLVQVIIHAIYDIHQFRDDCAIRALGSLIEPSDYTSTDLTIDKQAKQSYQYADAMMKAKFN